MYSFFEWLIETLKNVWSALSGFLGDFFTSVITWLADFFTALGDALSSVWENLQVIAVNLLSGLVSGLNAIIPDYHNLLPSMSSYSSYLTLAEKFVPLGLAWSLLLAFSVFCIAYFTFKLFFRVLS